MEVLFRATSFVLMLLISSRAFAAEDCSLPPEVQRQDLHKLTAARWVLIEGFADNPTATEIFKKVESSIVDLKIKDTNESFIFHERNVMDGGKCITFNVNMSVSDPETSNHTFYMHSDGTIEVDGEVSSYDDQGRGNFYQASPNCLILNYSAVFMGTPGRALLMYRSEGKHLDAGELKAAESKHRRIAECLKFNPTPAFQYDGKTEFC